MVMMEGFQGLYGRPDAKLIDRPKKKVGIIGTYVQSKMEQKLFASHQHQKPSNHCPD